MEETTKRESVENEGRKKDVIWAVDIMRNTISEEEKIKSISKSSNIYYPVNERTENAY